MGVDIELRTLPASTLTASKTNLEELIALRKPRRAFCSESLFHFFSSAREKKHHILEQLESVLTPGEIEIAIPDEHKAFILIHFLCQIFIVDTFLNFGDTVADYHYSERHRIETGEIVTICHTQIVLLLENYSPTNLDKERTIDKSIKPVSIKAIIAALDKVQDPQAMRFLLCLAFNDLLNKLHTKNPSLSFFKLTNAAAKEYGSQKLAAGEAPPASEAMQRISNEMSENDYCQTRLRNAASSA